jgi:hypothetical protein
VVYEIILPETCGWQRNGRGDNETIKEGGVPEEWKKPENAKKLRQKDVDARWTKKNDETHYSCKDHVKADRDSKLIVSYAVTPASVHDSREKSRVRARVEHVFGHMTNTMKGITVRSIGMGWRGRNSTCGFLEVLYCFIDRESRIEKREIMK